MLEFIKYSFIKYAKFTMRHRHILKMYKSKVRCLTPLMPPTQAMRGMSTSTMATTFGTTSPFRISSVASESKNV